jgi:hypothetical protein
LLAGLGSRSEDLMMRSEERPENDNAAQGADTINAPAIEKMRDDSFIRKCPGAGMQNGDAQPKGGCGVVDRHFGNLTIDGLGKPNANPRDAEGQAERENEGVDNGKESPKVGKAGDNDKKNEHEGEEEAEHEGEKENEQGENEDPEADDVEGNEKERGDNPESNERQEEDFENDPENHPDAGESEEGKGEGMKHDSLNSNENEQEPPIDDPEDNPDGTAPSDSGADTEMDAKMDSKADDKLDAKLNSKADTKADAKMNAKESPSDCTKIDPGDLELVPYPTDKLQAIKERAMKEVRHAVQSAGNDTQEQFARLPLDKNGVGYGQQHISFLRERGMDDAARSMSTYVAATGRLVWGQSMFERQSAPQKPPVDDSTSTWSLPGKKPPITYYKPGR